MAEKQLTWEELGQQISKMTETQKKQNVTLFADYEDEFYPLSELKFNEGETNTLDEGSPYLVME